MITPELTKFIGEELSKGISKEAIIGMLKTQGWTDADIAEGFSVSRPESAPITAPSTPDVVATTQVSETMPVVSNKHTIKKVVFSVLTVLVVCVLGFFGYASGYFVSLPNIFSNSMTNSQAVTGATVSMDLSIDMSHLKSADDFVKEVKGADKILRFNLAGAYHKTTPEDLIAAFVFKADTGSLHLAIETKAADQVVYARMTQAPDIGFFSLQPFANQWIHVPYKDDSEIKNNPLLSAAGADSKTFTSLTLEQKEHIRELFVQAKVLSVDKKHLPEMIDGIPNFHFSFILNKEGLLTYLKDITAYLHTINPEDPRFASVKDKDYQEIVNSLSRVDGEAWVGIFDHLPHKVTAHIELVDAEKPADGFVSVDTQITYKDFNKPLTVEVPKDAVTIEELFTKVMAENMQNNMAR